MSEPANGPKKPAGLNWIEIASLSMEIGLAIVIPLIIFIVGGALLDNAQHTHPLFILTGTGLGMLVSFATFYTTMSRMLKASRSSATTHAKRPAIPADDLDDDDDNDDEDDDYVYRRAAAKNAAESAEPARMHVSARRRGNPRSIPQGKPALRVYSNKNNGKSTDGDDPLNDDAAGADLDIPKEK